MDDKLSLIRYLEGADHGIALRIPLISEAEGMAEARPMRPGSYSRTIDATIRANGCGVVRDVQLVMQPDRYMQADALLPQPTNTDVETAWQNALAFHQCSGRAPAIIRLDDPAVANGPPRPFAPLFFCRHSGTWFHPICPACGAPLSLCRDDDLLIRHGLPPYTRTLERFLACRSCQAEDSGSRFFRPQEEPGDPDCVFDVNDLIDMWKPLASRASAADRLPCTGCGNADACYGETGAAAANIRVFAFFPFYLFLTPAPDCSGDTFIRLIGGDQAALTAMGRRAGPTSADSPFFFQAGERRFLEVLYLKLTFLGQTCRQFMPDPADAEPAAALALDGIGVDIAPAGAGLPMAWNFNVRIIDTVGTSGEAIPFTAPQHQVSRAGFLGALWFRTLLVNARQPADAVFTHAGRRAMDMQEDDSRAAHSLPADDADSEAADRVFDAGQIFWQPESVDLPPDVHSLWQESLRYGLQLVRVGLTGGETVVKESFIDALDHLRKRIRRQLFSPPVEPVEITRSADNSERGIATAHIQATLQGILAKWRREAATAAASGETTPEATDMSPAAYDDDPQTVVMHAAAEPPTAPLTEGTPADSSPAAAPSRNEASSGWDDNSQETVVYTGQPVNHPSVEKTPAPVEEDSGQRFSGLDDQATIVIPQSAVPSAVTETPGPDSEANDATVVIRPAAPPSGGGPADPDADLAATIHQHRPETAAGGDTGWGDESLEETVVLGSGVPPPPAGKPVPAPTGDDLDATIVQRSGEASADSPPPGPSNEPPAAGIPDDRAATVIIRPGAPAPEMADPDDHLAETMIQTPRTGSASPAGSPAVPPDERMPPPAPPVDPAADPAPGTSGSDDDDDILEQTVIIRSDVRKE